MAEFKRIKINKPFGRTLVASTKPEAKVPFSPATRKVRTGGFLKDQIVKVELDYRGGIKSHYWRERLKDAETDNCCELVEPVSAAKNNKKADPKTDNIGKGGKD